MTRPVISTGPRYNTPRPVAAFAFDGFAVFVAEDGTPLADGFTVGDCMRGFGYQTVYADHR